MSGHLYDQRLRVSGPGRARSIVARRLVPAGSVLLAAVAATLLLVPSASAEWSDPHWRSNKGHVLVVGDSHTWFAGSGRQYPRWDTSCQPGRDTRAGLAYLDRYLKERHRKVIFDLGTNDWENVARFRKNVKRARERIGRRDLYLVTTATSNPVEADPAAVNRIDAFMRRYAGNLKRVHLIDWQPEAEAHPRWFLADGVHFTSKGYAERTELIVDSVRPGGR